MENAPKTVITNTQLESVAAGLAALDGLKLKDGFVPFSFDDDTVWHLANVADAVTRAQQVFSTAKKMLAKQHALVEGMRVTPENAGSVAAFMESLDTLLAKEVSLPFAKLSRDKLNVGKGDKKNAIPPGVLAKLMPILE